MSDFVSNNTILKNGKDYSGISEILDKYTELSFVRKSALLLEISAFIGFEEQDLQKRAEHYSMVYFDSTSQVVQ
tara:strand:+ start:180 stop:401 length:222 start_codon:yes stop_codon:yes gene_type:complete